MEFLASPVEILGEGRQGRRRSGSSATASASPTPPAAARRCRSRAPSSWSRPRPSSRPSSRRPTSPSCRSSPSSRSTAAGSRSTRRRTPPTSRGVFACGDFVTGPTTLIEAAGHGKKCAYAIDRYLSGRTDVTVAANVKITSSWRHDMPEFYDVLPRQHIPMVPLAARMPSTEPDVNFNTPVELGYDANARGRRIDPLPDVQLQHLVRPVPLRAVRRLRGCLPRRRHPHGRHQPAQVRGRCCPSSRRPTAGTTAAR